MIVLLIVAIMAFEPGDKIIWGETWNCQGLVIEAKGKLLKVDGYCDMGGINFAVKGYISAKDAKLSK